MLRWELEPFLNSCYEIFELSNLRSCIVDDFNFSNINWNLVSESDRVYIAPGVWHIYVTYSSGLTKKKLSSKNRLTFQYDISTKKRDILDSVFLFKILRYEIDSPQLLSRIKICMPAKYSRAPIIPLYTLPCRTVLGAKKERESLSPALQTIKQLQWSRCCALWLTW